MKNKFLIIVCLLSLTAFTCTRESDDKHHFIHFYNSADYDIFVQQSYDYPDTSSYGGDVTTPGWNLKVESHHSNNDAIWSRGTYESKLREDTLIIFVFNADTLSTYGWNYVKDHNIVTQRYYLSLSDLNNLKWCLSFPPTEEMRDIKMWPPYGTYGHNGYRIN